MEKRILLKRKDVKALIEKTFPNYNGRKLFLVYTDKVLFYDTNASGGTVNKYVALKANGESGKFSAPAPWINPFEGKEFPLPVDVLVAERSYYCGTDCGITFYLNPANAPKNLLTPNV